jgi:hypothetical protein
LVLCGIENELLAFVIVMPSSHNIVASLCCSVDHFILIVAILKYGYKLVLNTIVRKISMIGTSKP